ncbi:MAG: hypothetical protein WD595_03210 [Waddliaceae bacterium]
MKRKLKRVALLFSLITFTSCSVESAYNACGKLKQPATPCQDPFVSTWDERYRPLHSPEGWGKQKKCPTCCYREMTR